MTFVSRFGCFAIVLSATVGLSAAEPLPSQIDKQIGAAYDGKTAGQADDAEFVRRLYLDLAGRIPTSAEAKAFLDDKSKDKRAKLVDKLIDGPEYARRMTEAFHTMLMERRGEHAEWTKFLTTAFEKNEPWDLIVRCLVDPPEDDEAHRGAAWFAVNRLSKVGQQDTDYPGLTRDIARLVMGMDLQCAQCHNHLFINDYKQIDFQGLYTVYLNTAIRTDTQFPAIRENLMTKKIEFSSVFDQKPLSVGPRVPGMQEVSIPALPKGEEYLVPPDPKTKKVGIPKFSPLAELAEQITSADNYGFRENIANRLWWLMMGRGVIDPLDQRHGANPPSHPELIKLLADELMARKYDMKSLLRDIAKSDAYARSSRWSTAGGAKRPEPHTYAVATSKPLSAEQMYHSVLTASGPHAEESFTVPGVEKPVSVNDLKAKFTKALANPPKEPELEFAPSVKSALFLMNDNAILTLFKPQGKNLVARLVDLKDAGAIADEMYLAMLSRRPTDEEKADVADLAWALAGSTEFCLNH
jgi:hypothetical protein